MNILPVCTLTVYIYVYIYINVRYYNDKKIEYFMILYFNNNFILFILIDLIKYIIFISFLNLFLT